MTEAARGRGLLLGLAVLFSASVLAAEETFPVLQVGSQSYTNVTVTSKTSHYIIVSHASGMASIKLKELSVDTLKQLGYAVDPPVKPQKRLLPANIQVDPRLKEFQEKATQQITERFRQTDPRVLKAVLAGLGVLYLLFCYCNMLICQKVGQQPGVLVWLPVLQTFPMLKAAGMSRWWFLLLLIPVINLAALGVFVCWCVKICRARAKSSWLALLLFLPPTSPFAFMYLAFADGGAGKDPAQERITFD